MAGGVGSRFWPLSRKARPKQFLDILGTGRTLLQQAWDRFSGIVQRENIYVVTCHRYKSLVQQQLPEISENRILIEPFRRNTAACVAYAAFKIKTINPDANLIVSPSDHVILNQSEFEKQIRNGLGFVSQNDVLLTLGIKPTRPESAYGYIQVKKKTVFDNLDNLYSVKTFTEKPDTDMARVFIEMGEFFWNSGIFVWSLNAFMKALETHLGDMFELFSKGQSLLNTPDELSFINKTYSECKGISLDYGILEKATNVYVLTSDFGWSDLGTWGSLYENKTKDEDGNVISSDDVLTYDTSNCIIQVSEGKASVIHGLDGFIVAESNDTLLICRRDDESQIKKFITDIRIKKGDSIV
jgi:mannose-1-phosphate guanylyltransferase